MTTPTEEAIIERAARDIGHVWQNYALPIGMPLFREMARQALATPLRQKAELLGALKEARGQVVGFMLECGHSHETAVENVARLDAAITKATGGQHD